MRFEQLQFGAMEGDSMQSQEEWSGPAAEDDGKGKDVGVNDSNDPVRHPANKSGIFTFHYYRSNSGDCYKTVMPGM